MYVPQTNEVMCLKRIWILLGGVTIGLSLCGLALTLAAGRSPQVLEIAARVCFLGAALCFFAAALGRPRAVQLNAPARELELDCAATSKYTFRDVAANDEARTSLNGLGCFKRLYSRCCCSQRKADHGTDMYRAVF